MSEEKKGFWSKVFTPKKSTGCCSVKIEELPDDAPDAEAAKEGDNAEQEVAQPEAAPCCCGPRPKSRKGGGCC